jgi:hypothetical protein
VEACRPSQAEKKGTDRLCQRIRPTTHAFLRFSDWLHARTRRTDGIALVRLMELLFEFLTGELKLDAKPVAETLWRDYQRGGRHDKPGFLKDFLPKKKKSSRCAGPAFGVNQNRPFSAQTPGPA